MNATQTAVYDALNAERRNMVDAFMSFLYQQQLGFDASDETAQVVQAALRGEGIIGSYDTVDALMEALDA